MSSKRNLKNNLFLLLIVAYSLVYFLLIVRYIPNYATTINGLFISAIAFISYLVYGFQNIELNKLRKKITYQVIISIFIYFTIIFGLGIFTGFLKNSYSLNILSIIKHITIPLISLVALELFRYIFVSSNKDSFPWLFAMTIAIILFDIGLNYKIIEATPLEIFIFISVTIIPLIFKNSVLSYLTYQTGYHSCLIYVIPLGLYKYFVPVLPDLGDYLTCVAGIILPSMIFIYSSRTISEFLKGKERKFKKLRTFIIDIPLVVAFSIFIGLISGYFNYHLIGVNTSAISPKVKRGDAVMLYKNITIEDLNKDDIIAYKSGNEIIVDIVAEKGEDGILIKAAKVSNSEYTYTKLNSDDIIGIYKFKIDKIAYPTIWFKDFIKG